MKVRLIQVIEVSEFEPDSTAMKHRYFLPNGAELEPARLLRADDSQMVMVSSDGKIYGGLGVNRLNKLSTDPSN